MPALEGEVSLSSFDSDGVRIAFEDVGQGRPIVLVHGFAASFELNWRAPGWVDALVDDGRRVVGLDCRGHGKSEKPHDASAYGGDRMAGDVIGLMDHLGLERADLMGYSMGGGISMSLLVRHPGRFNTVVLGGIGGGAPRGGRDRGSIAEAMEADDASAGENETARAFRAFAEAGGNDLQALGAMMRSGRGRGGVESADLSSVELPVLIVAGADDVLVGDPGVLGSRIPGSKVVVVPDRDHLTVVGDPRYKEAVLSFLAEHSA